MCVFITAVSITKLFVPITKLFAWGPTVSLNTNKPVYLLTDSSSSGFSSWLWSMVFTDHDDYMSVRGEARPDDASDLRVWYFTVT